MKKILIVLLMVTVLVGCGKKDELALGVYKERNYVNENFKLDFVIPDEFSYLTEEELKNLNDGLVEQSSNPEAAVYRNLILNVEHLDGTKLVGFVDAHPTSQKHKEAEANNYLDFLSSQDIVYKFEKSEKEINGITYLQLDLELPFDELQRNYITVINNKLVNLQFNYKHENRATVETLLSLYE